MQGRGPGPGLWLLALAVAHYLTLAFPCPSTCVCKWKGGKQTVECSNKGLNGIPEGLDPGTQVLDFSGNSVKVLSKDRFQNLGLVNLQRIFLPRCTIVTIADQAFSGLTNLVELDLSQNQITSVPTAAFKDFPSLMRLTLTANPIKSIAARAFQPLSYLTNLELSNCAIHHVEDDAFAGLDSLEWLKLDSNRLTVLRGDRVLPKTLHGVDIQNNPWECDCRMLDLRAWIINYKNPLAVDPTCNAPPRLRGVALKSLGEADLACLPEVSPTTLYLEIAEGKNVSLLCRVNAVPEARISWWFQGNVLQNDTMVAPGVRLLYFVEEGREEKKSELFIYHTNTWDNGTFACVAENSAGKMQSNYTIRIIVKEEPAMEISGFSMEYVMAMAGALFIVVAVVSVSIAVCIFSCRRQRRKRRKQESGKAVALHSLTPGKGDTERSVAATGGSKMNGTVFISDRSQHHTASYVERSSSQANTDPAVQGLETSFRNYTLEQNPDLINDAESVGKERRLKVVEESTSMDNQQVGQQVADMATPAQRAWQQVPVLDLHYQPLAADVHLPAGRFLDSDGYPADYGLPKLPLPHPSMAVAHQQGALQPVPMANLYRTLPHKSNRLHATSMRRYSREAEYLARPVVNAYDPFQPPDVRYTVDGYPTTAAPVPVSPGNNILSSPSAYKTDLPLSSPFPSALPCSSVQEAEVAPKRCSVGAQMSAATDVDTAAAASWTHMLTESPDEGYEGEGVDGDI